MDKEFIDEMEKQRNIMQKLTTDREAFRNLIDAYTKEDFEKFRDILDKIHLLPECWIVCQWICILYMRCEKKCRIICKLSHPKE